MRKKEEIKSNFESGDVPTQDDFAEMIDANVGVLDSNTDLPVASSDNLGVCYLVGGSTIYRCEESSGVYTWVAYPFTTESVNNYLNMMNKPSINGHVLGKYNTLDDIGAAGKNHTHMYAGSNSVGGAANKVENSLTLSVQGNDKVIFDGSSSQVLDITVEKIASSLPSLSKVLDDEDVLIVHDSSVNQSFKVSLSDLKSYLNS